MHKPRAFYESVAILTGAVIGAGILGIPYVAVRSGFWTAMLVLVVLGFAMTIVHLLLGEVALRTKKCHQLVGYAEQHLGVIGKWGMAISLLIGCYGAMIAYTLGVSESLMLIFGGSQWSWMIIFYAVMAWFVNGGLRSLGKSELGMEIVKFGIFFLIAGILFASPHFSAAKLTGFSWSRIFLPFGVIMFALMGTAAIPELKEETKKCAMLTRRAIIIGSLIPVIIYIIFTAIVVGVSGGYTTEVATVGLGQFIGSFGFILMHSFAILAMASSFVVMGFALKDAFWHDFGLKYYESWLLTMIIPILLIVLGLTSFFRTLDIAGAFAGGITGILIVIMHAKARKSGRNPEYKVRINYLGYTALIILFALGILYQVLLLF